MKESHYLPTSRYFEEKFDLLSNEHARENSLTCDGGRFPSQEGKPGMLWICFIVIVFDLLLFVYQQGCFFLILKKTLRTGNSIVKYFGHSTCKIIMVSDFFLSFIQSIHFFIMRAQAQSYKKLHDYKGNLLTQFEKSNLWSDTKNEAIFNVHKRS